MIGHFPNGNRNWFVAYSGKNIVSLVMFALFLGLFLFGLGVTMTMVVIQLIAHAISSIF